MERASASPIGFLEQGTLFLESIEKIVHVLEKRKATRSDAGVAASSASARSVLFDISVFESFSKTLDDCLKKIYAQAGNTLFEEDEEASSKDALIFLAVKSSRILQFTNLLIYVLNLSMALQKPENQGKMLPKESISKMCFDFFEKNLLQKHTPKDWVDYDKNDQAYEALHMHAPFDLGYKNIQSMTILLLEEIHDTFEKNILPSLLQEAELWSHYETVIAKHLTESPSSLVRVEEHLLWEDVVFLLKNQIAFERGGDERQRAFKKRMTHLQMKITCERVKFYPVTEENSVVAPSKNFFEPQEVLWDEAALEEALAIDAQQEKRTQRDKRAKEKKSKEKESSLKPQARESSETESSDAVTLRASTEGAVTKEDDKREWREAFQDLWARFKASDFKMDPEQRALWKKMHHDTFVDQGQPWDLLSHHLFFWMQRGKKREQEKKAIEHAKKDLHDVFSQEVRSSLSIEAWHDFTRLCDDALKMRSLPREIKETIVTLSDLAGKRQEETSSKSVCQASEKDPLCDDASDKSDGEDAGSSISTLSLKREDVFEKEDVSVLLSKIHTIKRRLEIALYTSAQKGASSVFEVVAPLKEEVLPLREKVKRTYAFSEGLDAFFLLHADLVIQSVLYLYHELSGYDDRLYEEGDMACYARCKALQAWSEDKAFMDLTLEKLETIKVSELLKEELHHLSHSADDFMKTIHRFCHLHKSPLFASAPPMLMSMSPVAQAVEQTFPLRLSTPEFVETVSNKVT